MGWQQVAARWPGPPLPGREMPRRAFRYRHDIVGGIRWQARESLGVLPPGAPTVVLVPGLGSGSYLLAHGACLAAHADVLIPDLPGFGRSRAPQPVRGIGEWADLLAAWHRAVRAGPATYVGSSFGAPVAAGLAVRHPELVERVVLVGPTFDPAAGVVRTLARWALTGLREPPGLGARTTVAYLQSGLGAPLRGFRAGLAHHLEDDVAELVVPLLLVRGEHDRIAQPDWIVRLARRAADARAVVVPGVAHTVDYAAPQVLAALVAEFLGQDR